MRRAVYLNAFAACLLLSAGCRDSAERKTEAAGMDSRPSEEVVTRIEADGDSIVTLIKDMSDGSVIRQVEYGNGRASWEKVE